MSQQLGISSLNVACRLGTPFIRKCPTIIYRLKNTVIPVYCGISWHHQLQTTSATIQLCELSAGSKSAFSEGVGHYANFRQMGTLPATHYPSMDLEIGECCSYNFAVAIFHTQKHCSSLREVEFCWQKQQNCIFEPHFRGLRVTYTVHLWLTGKHAVDFLLVLNFFAKLPRLRALRHYEPILVEIVVQERGWVTVCANFREKGVCPPTTVVIINNN